MSDILSFADELLQSIERIEGGDLACKVVSCSNSVPNDNVNDNIVDVVSTKDLLDDCLSPSRCTNNINSDNAKQSLVSSAPANTSLFEKTPKLHQAATKLDPPTFQYNHDKSVHIQEDKYMQAARNRLARDKELKQMKEDAALSFHKSCNLSNQESKSLNISKQECFSDNNDKNHNNLHQKDIDNLAYSCFEMFMNEVKEFQVKCKEASDTQVNQNTKEFIESLEIKYLKLSLNLLPGTNDTVTKVKMLITRFIDKCKNDSSADTIQKLINTFNSKEKPKQTEGKKRRNTWQCSLCLKKDLSVTLQKCITCGRTRGYRERDYAKDIRDGPSREGKTFIAESNYIQKMKDLDQRTSEEKKRIHYLYGKRDFEVDSRMQLKTDVSELLKNIRGIEL
jgi:hypothetical protein